MCQSSWKCLLHKAITLHSKPEAQNKSCDEGQEGFANMACHCFTQQRAPEVEVDNLSGNPLEYQYFSTIFREVVERKRGWSAW